MLRVRRYRIFLVFAVIAIIAVYHFGHVREWTQAHPFSVESLMNFGTKEMAKPPTPDSAKSKQSPTKIVRPPVASATKPGKGLVPTFQPKPPKPVAPEKERPVERTSTKGPPKPAQTNASKSGKLDKPLAIDPDVLAQNVPPVPDSDLYVENGQGRLDEPPPPPNDRLRQIHWKKQSEHFPVPPESIIPLPSGKAKAIPTIQFTFPKESANQKTEREKKLLSIKQAFEHAWTGYKDKAWLHDELTPVLGEFKDPFCGWGATLVDALDTLWIMGLHDDFKEAVEALKEIDFTTTFRSDIPLFETTIRYLGGLLAAYDLSEGKYKILLDKAIELAEILMGAFDTPNRMPVTFYRWKPTFASQPHRAGTRVVLAELGSLSVEFTRLAQLTKNSKYYDAIARITNAFEEWQDNTKLPGMWPVYVDASGCKKPDLDGGTPLEHSFLNGPAIPPPLPPVVDEDGPISPDSVQRPGNPKAAPQKQGVPTTSEKEPNLSKEKTPALHTDVKKPSSGSKEPLAGTTNVKEAKAEARDISDSGSNDAREHLHAVMRRTPPNFVPPKASNKEEEEELEPPSDSASSQKWKPDELPECPKQGLASPPGRGKESFTLGGMSDSLYEYFPKEYMLLGGLNDQYRKMYEKSIDVVKKYLLFRPMTKDERDILLSGTLLTSGDLSDKDDIILKPEGTHLTCFVGGMFAIGAKIFERPEDFEIAKKLTDGCVWAYESTATGIMPETFHALPCESRTDCPWNETKYFEALDPYRAARENTQIPTATKPKANKVANMGASTKSKKFAPTAKVESEKSTLGKAKRQMGDIEADKTYVEEKKKSQTKGAYTPLQSISHEEFVKAKIAEERLPSGFTEIKNAKYILRPEAIESVFIMFRITGDDYWREKGWKMFEAIQTYTYTEFGNTAIRDVTSKAPYALNGMESFWLAETLKYFYLLFSDPSLVNLDQYVLNTEAHPLLRPAAGSKGRFNPLG
ncbi:glycoside hydrolase family 47 protein [Xylona heveae TC161]|uniref:alpha-1,2-Mannosidase n=1 Tax=Xylona heveae (strain CBS 132557 / TC161) TaxID=1328760 RepID=A0A165GA45_XYLHT|nr:glycoside hydrolase family 47 protein [Xylona heveae TC161]KZF21936.1 glycoside hydrolase family 47 protein [Xylona heveae TC161]